MRDKTDAFFVGLHVGFLIGAGLILAIWATR